MAALNLARDLQPEHVNGRVIVIPCVSIDASRAYTRLWPSGANMNRSFPGSPTGPADEQLAHFLSTAALPALRHRRRHAQRRPHRPLPALVRDALGRRRRAAARRWSTAMLHWNTDWCCVYIDIAGTGLLVGEAERQGKIVVSTELGGGGHVTAEIHRLALSGLQNVLRRFGVIEGEVQTRASLGLPEPVLLMATELDNYLLAPESRPLRDGRRPRPAGRGGGARRPDPLPRAPRPRARGDPEQDRRDRVRRPCDRHDRAGRQRRRHRARGGPLGARLTVERFKVAATQVDVRHTDVEHNLEIHLQLIAEAAEAGCELIVFPETSATGNNGSVEVTRFAEPHDGRIFETIQEAGKGVWDRRLVRLLRALPRHALQHVGARRPRRADRAPAQGAASYDEFFRFRQAYEWGVYDLGFCTVGTAICHDSDFFESWRILALKGAEVILLPHANRTMPAGGGELTFDGRENHLPDEQILTAQEELLEAAPRPAAAPRLPRPRQRRLCGVLRHGRVRRSQHPRRRRLRPRARRLDARAVGALDARTRGSGSSSTPSRSSAPARTRGSRSRSADPRPTTS